jgi:hypothetical protein
MERRMPVSPKAMSERQKTKHIEVRSGLGLRSVQESEKEEPTDRR